MEAQKRRFISDIMSDANRIIIFGAGQGGREALNMLKKLGCRCNAFVDNNVSLAGKEIDGVPVYTKEYLEKQEENIVLFISPADSLETYEELSAVHKNVYPTEYLSILRRLSYTALKEAGYEEILELGHFYGPYPNIAWCEKYEEQHENVLYDISLRESEQVEWLHKMQTLFSSLPKWKAEPTQQYRYYFPNGAYDIGDALVLHCMIRLLEPKRILEVGSGFSSAVMLDTNDSYFQKRIKLSFVEPYPQRLKNLLREEEEINLAEDILQNIDLEYFKQLEQDDILFIDSSHVAKRDSDVNRIFFEILPNLQSGVYIHFHDILNGFVYPFAWDKAGRVWSEAYLLRAFLMNNNAYEIIYYSDMMREEMRKIFPYEPYYGGGSIWLRKK